MSVLICDDDRDTLVELADFARSLTKKEVHTANSEQEAYEIMSAQKGRVSALLTDTFTPNLDAYGIRVIDHAMSATTIPESRIALCSNLSSEARKLVETFRLKIRVFDKMDVGAIAKFIEAL